MTRKPSKQQIIEGLQSDNRALNLMHQDDLDHQKWQTQEIDRLREQVKALETDKSWLKQMHSAVHQSLQEIMRGARR